MANRRKYKKDYSHYSLKHKCRVKKCILCGQPKPLTFTYFYRRTSNIDGFRNECKSCANKRNKKWAKENKKRANEHKRKWQKNNREQMQNTRKLWRQNNPDVELNGKYKRTFGITLAEYDKLFKQQDGVCLICGLPEINQRLAVDHDHKTGEVRGLLCKRCNMMLGLVEESTHLLDGAIKYLKRYKNEQILNT
jgi:hypothetical protein